MSKNNLFNTRPNKIEYLVLRHRRPFKIPPTKRIYLLSGKKIAAVPDFFSSKINFEIWCQYVLFKRLPNPD